MRIISFAHTTPALIAGRKTVTRRDWAPRWAAQFHRGDLVQAWDRSPRARGRRVGTIRLTHDPLLEAIADMPDEDFEGEGFAWQSEHDAKAPEHVPGLLAFDRRGFDEWRQSGVTLWVVRFALVEVFDGSQT